MSSGLVFWIVLCAILLVTELLTGSFYLLMIAMGTALAGALAYCDVGLGWQILGGVVFSAFLVWLLHWCKARFGKEPDATQNPDVILDIGQVVFVKNFEANGAALVKYRGVHWDARHVDPLPPTMPSGHYRIHQVIGKELILAPNAVRAGVTGL